MSVVEWLESPEGEAWSRNNHYVPNGGSQLMSVKDDAASYYALLWYA